MTDVKMVVVDGVRYRVEDAPKRAEVRVEADGDGAQVADDKVEHKMRKPRTGARSTSTDK